MELLCPAGSLPALKAAIDHGADWVYLGLRDGTNARNFPGLNFDEAALAEGLDYAHARGRKVLMAVNTYPQAENWARWTAAVDRAARRRRRMAGVETRAPGNALDAVVERYAAGVDRSLLRRNLKLSPQERLEQLQELVRFAQELRRAGGSARRLSGQ
jgi:hypothetical protein